MLDQGQDVWAWQGQCVILHFPLKINSLISGEEGKALHIQALQRTWRSASVPFLGRLLTRALCVCSRGYRRDLLTIHASQAQPHLAHNNPPKEWHWSSHPTYQKPALISHHLLLFCLLKTEIIMYLVKKLKTFTKFIMEETEVPDCSLHIAKVLSSRCSHLHLFRLLILFFSVLLIWCNKMWYSYAILSLLEFQCNILYINLLL